LPDFALLNPGYISTSLVTTGPSRSEAFARYDRADASEGEGPLVHADVRAAWIAGSGPARTKHAAPVMPGFMPGIHVFLIARRQDVDGRNKSGHDEGHP
jgi:hypothetical protein